MQNFYCCVESENIQLTILFEFVSKIKIMFNAARNKQKPNSFVSLPVAITQSHTLYFMYTVQTTATAE